MFPKQNEGNYIANEKSHTDSRPPFMSEFRRIGEAVDRRTITTATLIRKAMGNRDGYGTPLRTERRR